MKLIPRLKDKILEHSNDYGTIERAFKLNSGLPSIIRVSNKSVRLAKSPVSIVIPVYIGERLDIVLEKLNKQVYKNFEVILIDDGSPVSVWNKVKDHKYSFPLKFIRVKKNKGTAAAINIGIQTAIYEIIVLMDQDMIQLPETIAKIAVRHQYTDNVVFVGFRECIYYKDYLKINKRRGPNIEDDWRIKTVGNNKFLDLTIKQYSKIKEGKKYYIIKETNYLKDFCRGKQISYWDLPTMVVGHSVSFKRKYAIKAGGFIENFFKGWGMDDISFGAALIAHNSYIIPALDWKSFHINHTRYSGSREIEIKELKNNLNSYLKKFLTLPLDKHIFTKHKIKKTMCVNNITYYETP